MIALTLAEIAAITSGTVHGAPDPSAQVTAPAACDSRQVTPGGTFAALPGARADGHDFAGQALAAGAACVLASRPVDGPAVVVPDVTAALGALARHVLSQLTDATVIAMTGSSGKTTTKDMLRHVLPQHGPVIAPPGSFNTEIGLPLTVLQADRTTQFPLSRNWNRHRLDVANAHAVTKQYAEAFDVLQQVRRSAPEWLVTQRYAKDILGKIIDKRRTLTTEMRELADFIAVPY